MSCLHIDIQNGQVASHTIPIELFHAVQADWVRYLYIVVSVQRIKQAFHNVPRSDTRSPF